MIKRVRITEVCGDLNAVGSKSDAHRALICAALCEGETEIKIDALNADIEATAECLNALGASVERTRGGYSVRGRALYGLPIESGCSHAELLAAMQSDKKRVGGKITLALPRSFGDTVLYKTDMSALSDILKKAIGS